MQPTAGLSEKPCAAAGLPTSVISSCATAGLSSSADQRTLFILLIVVLLFSAAVFCPHLARAQIFATKTTLPSAEVDRLEGAAAAQLTNIPRQLAEKQWEEALDALRRVMETSGEKFLEAEAPGTATRFQRYLPVREICQQRLASWAREAPAALALYRKLVDAQAEALLNEAREQHQPQPLYRIVGELWASQWADDAALLLADHQLAAGDFASARALLVRIAPLGPPDELMTLPVRTENFPDPSVPLADCHARQVVCSLLSGNFPRAERERAWFAQLHPKAAGKLGGKTGLWTELLAEFSQQTQTARKERDRLSAVPPLDPAGEPLWRMRLPRLTSDRDQIGAGRLRVADDMKSLRSYFPVVWRDQVLLRVDTRGDSLLAALGLEDGSVRWRVNFRRQARRDEEPPADEGKLGEVNDAHADLARHMGVARYEIDLVDDKAYVRLGSPLSGPRARRLDRQLAKDQGFLMGFDLLAEGKPLEGFPLRPESNDWAFEGPPLAAQGKLYAVMRRVEGARSQWTVACFELLTSPVGAMSDDEDDSRPTGRLLWRQRLASAVTLGGGSVDEIGSSRLVLDHNRLYCQTNSGVVAALDAETGKPSWIVTYERSQFDPSEGRAGLELFRDVNPPLVAEGLLICAPADSSRIFGLDAFTGRVVWAQPSGIATDAAYLLGVQGNWAIAAGDRLYWFDLATGRLGAQFPEGSPAQADRVAAGPRGLGRGMLHGGQVYWPTREAVLVFNPPPTNPPTAASANPTGLPAVHSPVREIALTPRGLTGGNLAVAGEILLIAAGEEIAALGPHSPRRGKPIPPPR